MIQSEIYNVMRAMPVFKSEMREANRKGLKWQTRRVMKLQPECKGALEITAAGKLWYIFPHGDGEIEHFVQCPYGRAGDFCYMREPLYHGFGGVAYYRDDLTMVRHALTGEPITWRWKKDILTSIFMPKEAARSVYQYASIDVERVQEITWDDAKAEGVVVWGSDKVNKGIYNGKARNIPYLVNAYAELWNSINAERGFDWDSNPWVWVLNYMPVEVQGER